MKFSIVTPNLNGGAFLEATLESVARQREEGVSLQHIVVDGGSTDGSLNILDRRRGAIDLIQGRDGGPAAAINRGFRRAEGEILAWLNSDDVYQPGALRRVHETFERRADCTMVFGHCRIVDERDREIRRFITRFKECFFPVSSRWMIQTINYISQPAIFFRRQAFERAGPLREDLKAAFDYDLILRLWRQGRVIRMPPPDLAAFRWHARSISAAHFGRQFREEYELARADAGAGSLQTALHWFVRFGIVASYTVMQHCRGGARES